MAVQVNIICPFNYAIGLPDSRIDGNPSLEITQLQIFNPFGQGYDFIPVPGPVYSYIPFERSGLHGDCIQGQLNPSVLNIPGIDDLVEIPGCGGYFERYDLVDRIGLIQVKIKSKPLPEKFHFKPALDAMGHFRSQIRVLFNFWDKSDGASERSGETVIVDQVVVWGSVAHHGII